MLKEVTVGELFDQAGRSGLSIKPEEFDHMLEWNNSLPIGTVDQLLYLLQTGIDGIISPKVLLNFLEQLRAKADENWSTFFKGVTLVDRISSRASEGTYLIGGVVVKYFWNYRLSGHEVKILSQNTHLLKNQ